MPEMPRAQLGIPGVDVIGGITDAVGGAVSSASSGVLNSFSEFLWQAGLQLLQIGLQLADSVGTVNLDLTAGPLSSVWPVTVGIGCSLAGILFYVQLVTVTASGGRGLLRALQGSAQFGIALAAAAGVFALVLLAADGVAAYILDHGLSSANFTAAFDKTGFSDTTANTVKGPALALLSVFGVVPIALGFAFENVMRAATIYLLVAVIPITAAGLLSGNTRSWFWKTANWALAAIAIKPVMALALWVGVAIAGSGSGLAQLITGLALMFVSLWAPLALFKLFAFTSTAATDAFKGGWSQAEDSTGSQGNGSSGNGATTDKASATMESSNEARYDSVSTDDTSNPTPTPNPNPGGSDGEDSDDGRAGPNLTKNDVGEAGANANNAVSEPTAVGHHGEAGQNDDPSSGGGPSGRPPRPNEGGPSGGPGGPGGAAPSAGSGAGGAGVEEVAAAAVI